MKKSYVLDTSAIFTLTKEESGSDVVEEILVGAKKRQNIVYLSFISLMELYYVTWQSQNEQSAKELIVLMQSLSIEKVHSNDRLMLIAGRLKANYQLSVADAIIAATAIEKEAYLVHKDPEFEAISQSVLTLPLPYKKEK